MIGGTWTCHVCGRERPDAKISVHSRTISRGEVEIIENVRYCNDDPKCEAGAKKVTWLGPEEPSAA